jgi:hypothetical protein
MPVFLTYICWVYHGISTNMPWSEMAEKATYISSSLLVISDYCSLYHYIQTLYLPI